MVVRLAAGIIVESHFCAETEKASIISVLQYMLNHPILKVIPQKWRYSREVHSVRILGLVTVALSGFAFAGDTSTGVTQTIEEWAPAKWGMTEPQVLKAFGDAARKLPSPQFGREFDGRPGTIAIDDVAVGGVSLRALFLFDRAGKLDGILLTLPETSAPTVE